MIDDENDTAFLEEGVNDFLEGGVKLIAGLIVLWVVVMLAGCGGSSEGLGEARSGAQPVNCANGGCK